MTVLFYHAGGKHAHAGVTWADSYPMRASYEWYCSCVDDYYSSLKVGKKHYLSALIVECGSDQKKLFRLINNLMGKSGDPPFPDHSSKSELANDFSSFSRTRWLPLGFRGFPVAGRCSRPLVEGVTRVSRFSRFKCPAIGHQPRHRFDWRILPASASGETHCLVEPFPTRGDEQQPTGESRKHTSPGLNASLPPHRFLAESHPKVVHLRSHHRQDSPMGRISKKCSDSSFARLHNRWDRPIKPR
jgi:hypothetical protein